MLSQIVTALLLCLAVAVPQQQQIKDQQSNSKVIAVLATLVVVALIIFFIDRRKNHVYSKAVRGTIGDIIMKLKKRKSLKSEFSQQIENQQPPTPKNLQFDHERTYIDAIPISTQEILKKQEVLPEEIKSDTPQSDFKEVFKVKESKSKHKINKKSKSKLKGRLLGKVSDDGQEHNLQASNLMEEGDISKDNSESEEYKNIETTE